MTFHAQVYCTRSGSTEEIVLDSRPSDALNLAVRYEAPIYMNKAIADKMASPLATYEVKHEVPTEVESKCRDILKRYHDPTVVHKVQMQIAVEEERFEDAAMWGLESLSGFAHARVLCLLQSLLPCLRKSNVLWCIFWGLHRTRGGPCLQGIELKAMSSWVLTSFQLILCARGCRNLLSSCIDHLKEEAWVLCFKDAHLAEFEDCLILAGFEMT